MRRAKASSGSPGIHHNAGMEMSGKTMCVIS
jgi:hypothetical protein